jgi:L-ascorbate metabolism protein UlaG (beta-lactamase superfamily)
MFKQRKQGLGSRLVRSVPAALALSAALHGADAFAQNGAPSAPANSPEATLKARQHYFGFENVDAQTGAVRSDRVIITWLTTTTFAVAANGAVFLLDAYLWRDEHIDLPARNRLQTTLQEMVDLRPQWIFLGHGHGDHADYAANIAYRTGATIFGAAEHCASMQVDAARQFGPGKTVSCRSVIPTGAPIGTQAMDLPDLKPALCLSAMRSVHGAATPPDPTLPPNGIQFTDGQDLRQTTMWGRGPEAEPLVSTSGGGGTLSMLYHFTVPGPRAFSFAAYDTVGPYQDIAPVLLPLLKQWRATDVLLGAVSGDNNTRNGLRDAAIWVRDMQPKIFVPTHHDQSQMRRGAAGNAGELWKRNLLGSMNLLGIPLAEQPEVRWLSDPIDYIRPSKLTFDPASPRWAKGARTNPTCS